MVDLTEALIAASRADRNAEKTLDDWLQANQAEMVQALAAEIATEGKPFQARQMAGIYLKNVLQAKSAVIQREKHGRWKALDGAVRGRVKESLLQAVRSPEAGLPHFAAFAAAEIATVELPFNEWPQFVPALMENVTSQQTMEPVKIASLECLGYTCERVAEVEEMLSPSGEAGDEYPELAAATVDSMLTTIVDGVQPSRPDKMRFAALQALRNSLAFVRKNMDVKNERDFILNAICEATRSAEATVRALAFGCMDQIAEYYYDKLNDYMPVIFQLTTEAIQKDAQESVKMAAIEFWTTLAVSEQFLIEEERDMEEMGASLDRPKCPKYVQAAMESLVPLLLETLTRQDEDADDDAWNIQACGAVCLETVSQTVERLIIPTVTPFVENNISNENWRFRDAAIVAFASILDGPATEDIRQYVSQSIPVLLACFNDPNLIVKDSATHCIAQICKLHLPAVPPEMVHTIIQGLIVNLKETARVAAHACSGIFNIATSMKSPEREQTNLLSTPMLPLLKALLDTCDREDSVESNLRVSAMAAAAELIDVSALDVLHLFRELLPIIVFRMDAACKIQIVSGDDKENKEQLLGLLCNVVACLFQRMEKADVLPQADSVMQLLLQILQSRGASCHEEALLAVGAVAGALEADFSKYLSAVMPFVVEGLRSFQAQSLCNVSIGVIVDICGSAMGAVQPFCDDIMGALMDCLKDASVHRDIKPVVIACFGDIAMAIGGAYEPYLQLSVMLLMQASQQPAPEDNEELAAFINSLRTSILEAYSGIIIGLAEGNALHLFVPHLPSVLQFMQYLATPGSNKDEVVLQKAVMLIGDIAQRMGSNQQVRQQINQPFVAQLIQEALGSSEDSQDTANWARELVQTVVQQAS